MIVDYLMEALAGRYDPEVDPDPALREERVAAARLYLWSTGLGITETAVQQGRAIPNPGRRETIDRTVALKLPEWRVPEGLRAWVDRRVEELRVHHDPADCRILAEVEACGATAAPGAGLVLLTFDRRFRTRLQPHTQVQMRTPSERWAALAIPRGTPPRWQPAPSSPIASVTWWHW